MKTFNDENSGDGGAIVPVFHGLGVVGVSGKDIASALRVSTASVSKWRNGHTPIPDDVMVFLTLLLGEHLSQAESGEDLSEADLDEVRKDLRRQERLNGGLPAMAIREGARRYRLWWNAVRNAALLRPENWGRQGGLVGGTA